MNNRVALLLLLSIKEPSRIPVLASTGKNYAVYFEPSDGKPNPRGEGYNPTPPSKWEDVHPDNWPVFVDWGSILEDTYWWEKGNLCRDKSRAEYRDKHRQSPVLLTSDDRCKDTEPIFHTLEGVCAKDEVRFSTTPYGLSAEFSKCEEVPLIEHSLNEDPWQLVHMVAKVPAEHKVNDHGDTVHYDGELQLHYKGSKDIFDKDLEGHAENIAVTSIFLKVRSDENNPELRKYIEGWEKYQEEQYEQCGVVFDRKNCELVDADRNPNLECEECFSNGCCNNDRRRLNDPSFTMNGYKQDRSANASVEVLIKNQEKEIERLLKELSRCQEGHLTTDAGARNLIWRKRQSDFECEGSYYCPVNLYKGTRTEFYWNYKGSLTVPPCTENIHWRVMLEPLIISDRQLKRMERLTNKHITYPECKLSTVGKLRGPGCRVEVNRPVQRLSIKHNLQMCDSFAESAFVEEETEDEEEAEDEEEEDEEAQEQIKEERGSV